MAEITIQWDWFNNTADLLQPPDGVVNRLAKWHISAFCTVAGTPQTSSWVAR
jgi:hypothetical protein